MAMFHFRLKSDKKPNGTSISAVQHVDYIQREGRFKNIDQLQDNNTFVGNFISSTEIKDAFGGRDALLYKTDDFGSIKNSTQGIEVTENASPTTLSIALMLADETMNHQPLILNGTKNFKKSILEAAVQSDLHISFSDKRLQNEFNRRKDLIENERKRFIDNGGTFIEKRSCPQPDTKFSDKETLKSVTQRGFCLPTLSQCYLVHSESQESSVLLSDDETRELVNDAKKFYDNVRWNVSDERRKLAQHTAKEILNRIEENMDQVFASSHVEYINREKAFAKRGGCIFHAHHLPKWAKDNPKIFFQAADKYEGKDNRRYREIEFALPNELKTIEQYRQIIDAFIDKHLKDHYYAYAIHDKIGMMSNGQHHPHVHIMFSERLIDDVEKTQEREPQNFFKYPARKKNGEVSASFEERRNHGAPKNRRWTKKSFLTELRADCAQIQNDVLQKNGFSIRVDHRSLKAQKEAAERRGDKFLAQLFDRIPEKYIGVISCQEVDNPKIQRLKEFRNIHKEYRDLIFDADALYKEIDELQAKDRALEASTNAKKFMDSDEFKNNSFDSTRLQFLRQDLLKSIELVNKWKRILISRHDAEEQAKLEYMTKEERELWHNFHDSLNQIKNLESFKDSLKKPQDKNALKSYNDVVDGINKKLSALKVSSIMMKSSIKKIEEKLETPDCKKNIQLVTHNILQQNDFARTHLKEVSRHLNDAVDRLRQEIINTAVAEEPKNIFKTKEVYNIVRRQFFGLKKELEKNLALKHNLQKRVISPDRALAMAKNIFVHGGFKKLREAVRQLKKDEQALTVSLINFKSREKSFQNKDWSVEDRSSFIQEKYALLKLKTSLDSEQLRLQNLKIFLENQEAELESFCQKLSSKDKIKFIAAGILRKNSKFVHQLEEVDSRCKHLAQLVKHTNEQIKVVKLRVNFDKPNTFYKVENSSSNNFSPNDSNSIVSIIADALNDEDYAVPLVAVSHGSLEMEKDWHSLSSLQKQNLKIKQILRELC